MIKKSLLLFAVNTAGRGFQYVYRVIMSHFLSLTAFGILSASLPYQSFALLLTSMSVTPTVSRFTSQYKIEEEEKIFSVFSLLLLGVGVGSILYISAGFFSSFFRADFSEVESLLKILSAAVPFAVLLSICTGIFLGHKKAELMASCLLCYQCVMVFASYFLVQQIGLNGAVLGIFGGYVISGIIAFVLVIQFGHPLNIDFREVVKIFRFSLPVLTGVIGLWALLNVDTLILARFCTTEEVGLYGMAYPTARLIFGFSVALSALLVPKVSELKYKGADTTVSVTHSLQVCWVVTLPLSVVLVAFAEEILYVLFGTHEGAIALQILAVGMLFYSLFFVGYSALQGLGRPHHAMGGAVVCAGISVGLCFLLIPLYGLAGAALATSISCVLGWVLVLYLLKIMIIPHIFHLWLFLPLFIFEYYTGLLEGRLLTMVVYGCVGLPFIAAYFYLSKKYLKAQE